LLIRVDSSKNSFLSKKNIGDVLKNYYFFNRKFIMVNRRLLTLTAIPVIVGAFGLVALDKASVANPLGLIAQNSAQPNQTQGQGQQKPHPRIDFAAAAAKLGISEAQLKQALGVPETPPTNGERPPRPDFKAAATKLGITEQKLIEALGIPPRPPKPNFAAAATKLGVSEAQLKQALGVPETPPTNGQRPPRPDFKAAAEKLGVTEQKLIEALGIPPHPPGAQRPAQQ
jgi:hypothetical protein